MDDKYLLLIYKFIILNPNSMSIVKFLMKILIPYQNFWTHFSELTSLDISMQIIVCEKTLQYFQYAE